MFFENSTAIQLVNIDLTNPWLLTKPQMICLNQLLSDYGKSSDTEFFEPDTSYPVTIKDQKFGVTLNRFLFPHANKLNFAVTQSAVAENISSHKSDVFYSDVHITANPKTRLVDVKHESIFLKLLHREKQKENIPPSKQVVKIQKIEKEPKITSIIHKTKPTVFFSQSNYKACYFYRRVKGADAQCYLDGPVLKAYNERSEYFNMAEWVSLFLSTLYHLQFAHQHDIIHRDVKPDNIIIQRLFMAHENAYRLTAYLVDFGLSKWVDDEVNEYVGTKNYLSPEAAAGNKQTKKSDIYSLGKTFETCLMYNNKEGYENISDFITTMQQDNPAKRPTVEQCIETFLMFYKDITHKDYYYTGHQYPHNELIWELIKLARNAASLSAGKSLCLHNLRVKVNSLQEFGVLFTNDKSNEHLYNLKIALFKATYEYINTYLTPENISQQTRAASAQRARDIAKIWVILDTSKTADKLIEQAVILRNEIETSFGYSKLRNRIDEWLYQYDPDFQNTANKCVIV